MIIWRPWLCGGDHESVSVGAVEVLAASEYSRIARQGLGANGVKLEAQMTSVLYLVQLDPDEDFGQDVLFFDRPNVPTSA